MILSTEVMNLPPGFRFNPMDDELINCYLKPKIMGQKLPCNIIKDDDVQVYAPDSTPWLLFDLGDPDSWIDSTTNSEKSLYVFTSLSKIATSSNKTTSKTRSNTRKRAGCGAWVQKSKPFPIIDREKNVIGEKRMLNFVIHDIEAQSYLEEAVYFKMHEYSLCGINDDLASDRVLCKITFDPTRESFCKLATKTTTDQVPRRRGRKPQNRKQNNKILEESRTLTSESVPAVMSSSNVCQESRVGNDDCYAPYNTSVQDFGDFAGGLCLDGQGGGGLCFDDLGLEESRTLTSESVPAVMSSSSVCQESRVGNDDCYATAPYNTSVQDFGDFAGGLCLDGQGGGGLCFDGQGGEGICFDDLGLDDLLESFDIADMKSMIMSIPEVEDGTIHGHGKRKSAEWDNPCQAKKMCF